MRRNPGFVRKLARLALVAGFLALGGCPHNSTPVVPSPTAFPALTLERAFPTLSFSNPVAMLQAPGNSSRWYVVERGGRVVVFPNIPQVAPGQVTPVIQLAVNTTDEGGLLGMAFHPDFPATPQVFLSYTRTGPDGQHPLTSVIARYTSPDGGKTLDPNSAQVILMLDQPYTNHNGGNLAFDRTGRLFIGFGDGGSANDPQNNAQNVNTLLGKMLRIDINGAPVPGKTYAIPNDNPFAAGGGAPEIYAWGLRNPWRWSFDRDDGRLWVADVGQGTWEEVDLVTLGGNYGWRDCEGAHLRGSSTPCSNPAYINPVAEYDHGQGCSITGGYVYRGPTIAGLTGVYLFGDFCAGTIWGLREMPGAAPVVQPAINSGLAVVSFAQGNDGELYVVDFGGTLQHVVAAP